MNVATMSDEKRKMRNLEVAIVAKAMRDGAFRQELMENPREVITRETGVEIPFDFDIQVHEVTNDTLHLVIPKLPDEFPVDRMTQEELEIFILTHAALSDGSANTGSCCCDTLPKPSLSTDSSCCRR